MAMRPERIPSPADQRFLRVALRLARRGFGATSPNPMVGAVLVKDGKVIGRGWHRRAGQAHAEVAAIRDAQRRGRRIAGATLYVTLEPCCTQGRTPPCTQAIISAGIRWVVAGATDPNPRHSGRAFEILKRAGISVTRGVLAEECTRLNETFNHWIVRRTPLVTVKAAMTLDGKIATATGESKWITGERARSFVMKLRQGADAILAGVNTILRDDPSLTCRRSGRRNQTSKTIGLRRIILDARARTPLAAKVVSDEAAALTTIVVGRAAPASRVRALARRVRVLVAPLRRTKHSLRLQPDLQWLLRRLGAEQVTGLLVEGGGEVNASFLLQGLAQRVAFFYAPKILGGDDALRAVAGAGAQSLRQAVRLNCLQWRRLGSDWLLLARTDSPRV